MKDVIRRGVDRQVAEGMFERAQERMQHQFQQLKVFDTHSLNSSPKEASWREPKKQGRTVEEVVVIRVQKELIPSVKWPQLMPTMPGEEASWHLAFPLPRHCILVLGSLWDCDFSNATPPALSPVFPLYQVTSRTTVIAR